jgi:hypothetical protein
MSPAQAPASPVIPGDIDPEGVLARISASAPQLTAAQRSRIGLLLAPQRADHFADKFGATLRAQR